MSRSGGAYLLSEILYVLDEPEDLNELNLAGVAHLSTLVDGGMRRSVVPSSPAI